MYYDVLINYLGLDPGIQRWSCLSKVRYYNVVKYFFKKEINSGEYFVYVRKVFEDKQSGIVTTRFKRIDSFSYTFSHFPMSNEYRNKYYVQKFNDLIDSYDGKEFING